MNYVKYKRMKLGWSQDKLAEKSGVSRSTIHVIEENGEIDVKLSTLKALAKALKCSLITLVKQYM
ncbi:MAG: helix-turn-helix transcriptional regulator [Paludibacteraceae bacterium]|nr:helix-turn-helix transcriptional regulator [Paludibacteraceae bacterium]